jgi:hypothetical protein
MTAQHDWLKNLTRRLINECGGVEAASKALEAADVPHSLGTISRAQNGDHSAWLSLPQISALEQFCGKAVVSEALATNKTGSQPIPRNTKVSAHNLVTLNNSVRKELMDVDQETERAVADDRVTNTELNRLIQATEDVVNAAQKHLGWLCAVRSARRQDVREAAE